MVRKLAGFQVWLGIFASIWGQLLVVETQNKEWLCCCSVAQLCLTLRSHGLQHARLPCPLSSPKVCSIESVMLSYYLLCRPLLLLPSIFLSIKVFSNEATLCIRWPKYWSFSISPSNDYSGLISFRIGWFDHPAVQRTLKSSLYKMQTSFPWNSLEEGASVLVW